ncbi:MAG: hypothetical protein ABJB47_11815 [Actinomycetota bacterium]
MPRAARTVEDSTGADFDGIPAGRMATVYSPTPTRMYLLTIP